VILTVGMKKREGKEGVSLKPEIIEAGLCCIGY
jgi:hypothetical protein